MQRTSAKLVDAARTSLKDLITNFNTTTAAFASEEGNLRQTIALLPRVLERAGPAFDSLNASFPPTRAFAREILPGVRETPATIEASFPWIAQTRALVSPAELQGLVRDLRPATASLSAITNDTIELLPQVDLVNRCFTDIILPTGDYKIDDGFLTTGLENYKEFWQAMVALSGEGQNFDGNGPYVRFQTGGGQNTLSTGPVGTGQQGGDGPPFFGNFVLQPIGTRPARPATKPPVNRKKACHTNTPPDLNSARSGGRPVRTAIRKHLRDFVALLVLFVIGLGVGGYITSNQRLYLPGWVPGIGTDFYELEAEFQTAQAVVPGQGQTVDIAGVPGR